MTKGFHQSGRAMREYLAHGHKEVFSKLINASNRTMSHLKPKRLLSGGSGEKHSHVHTPTSQDRLLRRSRVNEDTNLFGNSTQGSKCKSTKSKYMVPGPQDTTEAKDIVLYESDKAPGVEENAKSGKRQACSKRSSSKYGSVSFSEIADSTQCEKEVTLPPIKVDFRRSRSLSPEMAKNQLETNMSGFTSSMPPKSGRKVLRKKLSQDSLFSEDGTSVHQQRKAKARSGSGKKSVVGPSMTDYDFLRRALSDDKQPFLPPPSQRRMRSNSLPTDTGLTSLQLQQHLQQFVKKSGSDEALQVMKDMLVEEQEEEDGGHENKEEVDAPPQQETEAVTKEDESEKDKALAGEIKETEDDLTQGADKQDQTRQWITSLRSFSPEPLQRDPTPRVENSQPRDSSNQDPSSSSSSSAAAKLGSNPPHSSSNTSHGVLVPRKDSAGQSRRQSLNLVVVYGSQDEVEFKPVRSKEAYEKKRWDAFPFGRVYQALKLKLSSPNLVIDENDVELETCST